MENYSVLMSVYDKENAEYLKLAMKSMFEQTVLTDDFVLVCDGPLTEALDSVIEEMSQTYGDILNVVRLEVNSGLGNALNEGLMHCKNELVARMDSDDVSMPNRCEKQLEVFRHNEELAVCSGVIVEFEGTIHQEIGRRCVPKSHEEICRFSRKRNPFNHPAVMFRKTYVEQVGGYKETYHLFEDYYLWIRMLMKGYKGYNIQSPLLYMRSTKDMYKRRGGCAYAKDMLRFHKWMKQEGWSSFADYLSGAVPHGIVCVLPNGIRKIVYKVLR